MPIKWFVLKEAGLSLLHKFYEWALVYIFTKSGKKPWTRGYGEYRKREVSKALATNSFNSISLPKEYGFRLDERIIEYPWLFSRLPAVEGRLLDAGSILNFDFILSNPILENKKLFISTLAPEHDCFANQGVSYVYEDLRDSCFKNEYFDWIVSLSTIEHIGLDNTLLYTQDKSKNECSAETYLMAIKEYYRMLKPGGKLYLSVPFGRAKNHGWFQVFDSKMIDQLIAEFSPSKVDEFHFKYLSDGWRVSSRDESSDATCFDIHLNKNYDSDFAAFSRGIICLELVK